MLCQHGRQVHPPARTVQPDHRIFRHQPFAHEEPKKPSKRRQATGRGGRSQPQLLQMNEKTRYRLSRDVGRGRDLLTEQKGRKLLQVASVGLQRLRRESAFNPEIAPIPLDQASRHRMRSSLDACRRIPISIHSAHLVRRSPRVTRFDGDYSQAPSGTQCRRGLYLDTPPSLSYSSFVAA